MSNNPYAAPYTPKSNDQSKEHVINARQVVQVLSQTKPWVRIICVLMYLIGGFTIVGGIFMLVFAPIAGVVYLAASAIYLVPASFLWAYATKIAGLEKRPSEQLLFEALKAQKSFWKFVGITALVILLLYILAFIFVIVMGGAFDSPYF